jgi:hypothetical protein
MSTLEMLMIAFIVVTALAVVIQMGVLIGLYLGVRPLLATVQKMLQDYRPTLDVLLNNAAATATTVKQQTDRLEAAVAEISDRVRLRANRLDELVGRTFDRVENATELVNRSAVRQTSGVAQGIAVGLATLFSTNSHTRAKGEASIHTDEMSAKST